MILGIDGGGTKVDVTVLSGSGRVVGRSVGGPCNIAAMHTDLALESVTEAGERALLPLGQTRNDVMALCAGVAGYSHVAHRRDFRVGLSKVFPNAAIDIQPDYVVAHDGAFRGRAGVIAIAGTGSAAYGCSASGDSHRTGGYGYLIDDRGSGYGVGRLALAAILKQLDGTGERTTLTQRCMNVVYISKPSDLIAAVFGGELDRVSIAALAREVAAAATVDCDAVSIKILEKAAMSLADLCIGVIRTLGMDSIACPVCPIGSLWGAGPVLTGPFMDCLSTKFPQATVVESNSSPSEGAARRALRLFTHS